MIYLKPYRNRWYTVNFFLYFQKFLVISRLNSTWSCCAKYLRERFFECHYKGPFQNIPSSASSSTSVIVNAPHLCCLNGSKRRAASPIKHHPTVFCQRHFRGRQILHVWCSLPIWRLQTGVAYVCVAHHHRFAQCTCTLIDSRQSGSLNSIGQNNSAVSVKCIRMYRRKAGHRRNKKCCSLLSSIHPFVDNSIIHSLSN